MTNMGGFQWVTCTSLVIYIPLQIIILRKVLQLGEPLLQLLSVAKFRISHTLSLSMERWYYMLYSAFFPAIAYCILLGLESSSWSKWSCICYYCYNYVIPYVLVLQSLRTHSYLEGDFEILAIVVSSVLFVCIIIILGKVRFLHGWNGSLFLLL